MGFHGTFQVDKEEVLASSSNIMVTQRQKMIFSTKGLFREGKFFKTPNGGTEK